MAMTVTRLTLFARSPAADLSMFLPITLLALCNQCNCNHFTPLLFLMKSKIESIIILVFVFCLPCEINIIVITFHPLLLA